MSRFFILSALAIVTSVFVFAPPGPGRNANSIKHHVWAKKDLVSWLDLHDVTKRRSKDHSIKSFKGLDRLSLSYAKIVESKKTKNQHIEQFRKEFSFAEVDSFDHVLYPYFLELNHSLQGANYASRDQSINILLRDPTGLNCPAYDHIRKHLSNRRLFNSQINKTSRMLQELARSNNYERVRDTLSTFLKGLSYKNKKYYKGELHQLALKFPNLSYHLGDHLSFLNHGSKLEEASANLMRRHCNAARRNLILYLKGKPAKTLLPRVKQKVAGILECYQWRPTRDKIWVLKTLLSPMKRAFGENGRAFVRLQIAELYWSMNHLKTASWIVNNVLKSKAALENYELQADAFYVLARVAENRKDYQKAQQRYELIISRFTNHHRRYDIMKSLLLIYIGQEKWEEVYKLTNRVVSESQIEKNKASDDQLEYFLFWAGRSAAELDKKSEAIKYWKYAASHFYSTYYGGLSHHMVERYTGKKYFPQLLEPFNPSFNSFKASFPAPMLSRIERVEALLKLGLSEQAICEIGEIQDPKDQSYKLKTMRALLLHASGQWLEAIKIYRGIPREFRSTLPYGFEKILFPKRYAENIEYYSSRSGIDPDLVFSVIRQESVFDPKAFSGAGARGLMQLMRRTARFEAVKLKNSYVSFRQKRHLINKSRYSASLFDIETNIILGTHYLARMLERFRDIPIGLAAYNAGPTVSHKWEKRFDTDNPLYFIERIPYEETRNYVKLILRNYFYYKKWYGGVSESLPYLDRLF